MLLSTQLLGGLLARRHEQAALERPSIGPSSATCRSDQLDSGAQQQWSCQNLDSMRWRLAPNSGGWYQIRSGTNGHCLGGRDGLLWTQDCDNSTATLWDIVHESGDVYSIRNGASGKCMDVPYGSSDDGVGVTTYACARAGAISVGDSSPASL